MSRSVGDMLRKYEPMRSQEQKLDFVGALFDHMTRPNGTFMVHLIDMCKKVKRQSGLSKATFSFSWKSNTDELKTRICLNCGTPPTLCWIEEDEGQMPELFALMLIHHRDALSGLLPRIQAVMTGTRVEESAEQVPGHYVFTVDWSESPE